MSQVLPNGAAAAINRYLDALDATAPGLATGVYVVGSLALGDYHADRSDIDVVVVVDHAPDVRERPLLAEVHRVVATRIDGPYCTASDLAGPPEQIGDVPYHVDGRFEMGECYECNPVTWAILAECAITVRGDAPDVKADVEAVRAFSAKNLAGYWTGWARTIAALLDGTLDDDTMEARMLEWGVLGVARVHCAAETGDVISKRAAGEYARAQCGPEWHETIALAIESRDGAIDQVTVGQLSRACAFVRALAHG